MRSKPSTSPAYLILLFWALFLLWLTFGCAPRIRPPESRPSPISSHAQLIDCWYWWDQYERHGEGWWPPHCETLYGPADDPQALALEVERAREAYEDREGGFWR